MPKAIFKLKKKVFKVDRILPLRFTFNFYEALFHRGFAFEDVKNAHLSIQLS